MDEVGVARDVVTYNAVLDAVSSQIELGRKLFQEGMVDRVFCGMMILHVFFALSLLC